MAIAISVRVVAAIRRRCLGLMAVEGRGEGTGLAGRSGRWLCSSAGTGSLRGGESCRGLSGIAQFGIAVVTGEGLRTVVDNPNECLQQLLASSLFH